MKVYGRGGGGTVIAEFVKSLVKDPRICSMVVGYELDDSIHGLCLLCSPLIHVGDDVASSGTSSRRMASRPTQCQHFELCSKRSGGRCDCTHILTWIVDCLGVVSSPAEPYGT